jgi:nucleotide-binding universal stress UspA family protein
MLLKGLNLNVRVHVYYLALKLKIMKNILVPVDFSVFSESAAKMGVFLARKTGAQLHLMHVANAPADWNGMNVVEQQRYPEIEGRMVEAEIRLDKFVADILFKDITTNTYVYAGTAYDQILQFVESYKMDLVIMGAHGAGETYGLFIGSTAQRVIRSAKCPVLSVKKEYTPKEIKNILFPSDFDENKKALFNVVKEFAEELKADMNLLFVNTPGGFADEETAEDKLSAYIPASNGITVKGFVYNALETERGIINFSEKEQIDLIAMTTHNRKGKPNYLLGVTETVLFHSDVPILSIVQQV